LVDLHRGVDGATRPAAVFRAPHDSDSEQVDDGFWELWERAADLEAVLDQETRGSKFGLDVERCNGGYWRFPAFGVKMTFLSDGIYSVE
jgi:hypothetical protein